MGSTVDIALIGAGAAGLSLALRLADGGYGGRVLLVEPSRDDRTDRTWCGWSDGGHPFAAARVQRWWQWAVSAAGEESVCTGQALPYEMLDAGAVRRIGWAAVQRRRDWLIRRGRAVAGLRATTEGFDVTLDDGETHHAAWVLDARPLARRLERPWLWQAFAGVELADAPPLDPDTVRLMDFTDGDGDGALVSFTYQLPISPRRRLVELTHFAPQPIDRATVSAGLDRLCRRLGLEGASIQRREYGCLPMAPPPPQPGGRHLRIGAAGGSLRPATGYAFHAIQRWAERCARQLLDGQAPIAPPRRRGLEWLDRVFLEALWRKPQAAPAHFLALFRGTPADSLTRFLMGEPKPGDLLRVVRSLPTAPLLGAAAAAPRSPREAA